MTNQSFSEILRISFMFSQEVKHNKQHSKLVPDSVKTIEKCFQIIKFNQ